MRKNLMTLGLLMGLGVFGPVAAYSDDKWEANSDDNAFVTVNQLVHGGKQTHDAQGTGVNSATPDFDWIRVATRLRHSYEARVSGEATSFSNGSCSSCAQFDRVNAFGTQLQNGFAADGTFSSTTVASHSVLRWEATANQYEFIRIRGLNGFATNANDQYDVEFFDTTYFGPRFNNSGSQITVLLIQNANKDRIPTTVTGNIYFYNGAGTLLATVALNVPEDGVQVLSTASVPGLAGQSGAVTIAHTGGYGALAAKSVALEPSTGFSFDTPFTTIPR